MTEVTNLTEMKKPQIAISNAGSKIDDNDAIDPTELFKLLLVSQQQDVSPVKVNRVSYDETPLVTPKSGDEQVGTTGSAEPTREINLLELEGALPPKTQTAEMEDKSQASLLPETTQNSVGAGKGVNEVVKEQKTAKQSVPTPANDHGRSAPPGKSDPDLVSLKTKQGAPKSVDVAKAQSELSAHKNLPSANGIVNSRVASIIEQAKPQKSAAPAKAQEVDKSPNSPPALPEQTSREKVAQSIDPKLSTVKHGTETSNIARPRSEWDLSTQTQPPAMRKETSPPLIETESAAKTLKMPVLLNADPTSRISTTTPDSLSIVELSPRLNMTTTLQSPPAQTYTAQDAKHIAQQLAVQFAKQNDGTTVIRLNPEELGPVRLSLRNSDGVMAMTILAERPETAEIMRRNIGELAQEFQALGYTNLQFDFGGGEAESNNFGDQPQPHQDTMSDTVETDQNRPRHPQDTPDGRLDLHL
jgi:flagellar hook-length control protein FliK